MTVPAVIYARRSVDRKDEHSPSLESQIKACRRACTRERLRVVGVFQDRGISGAREDRPGLWAAINACPQGGVFVCFEMDRFSRSIKHAFTFLEDHLLPKRISLFCPGDGVDTRTEAGREQFGYMALGAERERRRAASRIRRWYQHDVLERGRAHGRIPYGFLRVGGHLVPDPERASTVQLIFRFAADGFGAHRLATELHRRGIAPPQAQGLWRITTLRELLTCPTYAGWVGRRLRPEKPTCWQDLFELYEGAHEGIVERGVWEAAQEQIWSRRGQGRGQSRAGYPFLLIGLLRCAECGSAMGGSYQYRRGGRRYPRYTCLARKGNSGGCLHGQTVGAKRVEDGFVRGLDRAVRQEKGDFHVLYHTADETAEQRQTLEAVLAGISRREANLLRALERDELVPEVVERVNRRYVELEGDRRETEGRLLRLDETAAIEGGMQEIFAGYPQLLRSSRVSVETKRIRLRRYIVRVTFGAETGYEVLVRRSALCAITEP